MSTIETLKEDWKVDVKINQMRLNDEIVKVPVIHAKYLDYFVLFRAKRSGVVRKLNTLKNIKRRYYRGELDQTELKEYGWNQWQGLKPSAAELKDLFEQDPDVIDLEEKLEYFNTALITVEYIMKSINSRGYELKTLYELRRFEAGG